MNFIVVHSKGQLTGVSIEPAGRAYPHPIKCWAMNDGRKVTFARTGMAKLLDKFHVGGTYDTMALYGLSFDEVCMMIRERVGPSDDELYEQAIAHRTSPKPKVEFGEGTVAAITVATESSMLLMHVFMLGVKLVATMLLIPFILALFKRH